VRWPGHVPAGRVSARPWAAYDVLPTFLEAAGAPASALPAAVQGASVLDLFLGREDEEADEEDGGRPPLYWKFGLGCEGKADYNTGQHPTCCDYAFAARDGAWKVRWWSNPNVPIQLYNLTSDLHEDTNVDAGHPGVAAGIIARAQAAYDVASPWWPDVPCHTSGTTPLTGPCEGEE
jgi:arylsulfatase